MIHYCRDEDTLPVEESGNVLRRILQEPLLQQEFNALFGVHVEFLPSKGQLLSPGCVFTAIKHYKTKVEMKTTSFKHWGKQKNKKKSTTTWKWASRALSKGRTMRTLDSGRQKAGIIIDKITTIYGLEGFCVAHDFGMRSPVKTRRRKKEK